MLEDAPVFLFGSTESFERLFGLFNLVIHNFRHWGYFRRRLSASFGPRFCANFTRRISGLW
jgi:hypothetical protein